MCNKKTTSLPSKAVILHEFGEQHEDFYTYTLVVRLKSRVYSASGTAKCNTVDDWDVVEGKRVARARAMKWVNFMINEDRYACKYHNPPYYHQLRCDPEPRRTEVEAAA